MVLKVYQRVHWLSSIIDIVGLSFFITFVGFHVVVYVMAIDIVHVQFYNCLISSCYVPYPCGLW
jgi:hypothetical protein